jgi:hypothetical protein
MGSLAILDDAPDALKAALKAAGEGLSLSERFEMACGAYWAVRRAQSPARDNKELWPTVDTKLWKRGYRIAECVMAAA